MYKTSSKLRRPTSLFFILAALILLSACGKKDDSASGQASASASASESISDAPVTLNMGAYSKLDITELVIPASVTEIKSEAVVNCDSLRTVVIEGAAEIRSRAFKSCPALESVTFGEGTTEIDMSIFLDCPALHEIHVPASCKKIIPATEKGVTYYTASTNVLAQAAQTGWDVEAEGDLSVLKITLADAVAQGLLEWQPDGDSGNRVKLIFRNTSDQVLLIEKYRQLELQDEENGRTLFIDETGNWILLYPGRGTDSIYAGWYADYGPGDTCVEIAAESEYIRVLVYKKNNEEDMSLVVQPYERVSLTLPAGRYGFDLTPGETDPETDPDGWEDKRTWFVGYKTCEEDSTYEISPGLLGGGGFQFREEEEYGPGESKLFLHAMDGRDTCYRLVRVGGEEEFKVMVSPFDRETMTFPSGWYRLRIASGDEWISDEEAFGEEGKYEVIDYFYYEEGESYQITTTYEQGNVHGDKQGGFRN